MTPVVAHGNKNNILESSIKNGVLWSYFITLKLHINMRTGPGEKEFSEWLLKLGELLFIIIMNSIIYRKIIKR